MLKILLPVDGSDSSNKSVADFIQSIDCYKEMPEIHLLNVQLPLDGNVSFFIDKENIKQYHQEEGMKNHRMHVNYCSKRDLLVNFIL